MVRVLDLVSSEVIVKSIIARIERKHVATEDGEHLWQTNKQEDRLLRHSSPLDMETMFVSLFLRVLFYNPATAKPFLLYSLLSNVLSMNSATSARVMKYLVPVLHCPSSTL